ncbi:hypothetical protein J6590_074348 [Homalodisca vitripennis]|nr:hypothetical protein J6590_074348 [Homalodisca vitripennis]
MALEWFSQGCPTFFTQGPHCKAFMARRANIPGDLEPQTKRIARGNNKKVTNKLNTFILINPTRILGHTNYVASGDHELGRGYVAAPRASVKSVCNYFTSFNTHTPPNEHGSFYVKSAGLLGWAALDFRLTMVIIYHGLMVNNSKTEKIIFSLNWKVVQSSKPVKLFGIHLDSSQGCPTFFTQGPHCKAFMARRANIPGDLEPQTKRIARGNNKKVTNKLNTFILINPTRILGHTNYVASGDHELGRGYVAAPRASVKSVCNYFTSFNTHTPPNEHGSFYVKSAGLLGWAALDFRSTMVIIYHGLMVNNSKTEKIIFSLNWKVVQSSKPVKLLGIHLDSSVVRPHQDRNCAISVITAYHALYADSTSSVLVGSYHVALRLPAYHALYADSTSSVLVGSYHAALRPPAYHALYDDSKSSDLVGSYHVALRLPAYHALYADITSSVLVGSYHDALRPPAYHTLNADSTSSVLVGSYHAALRLPAYHAIYAYSTSSVLVESYHAALRLPAYHALCADSTSSVLVGSYYDALRPPANHALYAYSTSSVLVGSYHAALRLPAYRALYDDSTSSVLVGSYHDTLRLPAYHALYADSTSSVLVGSYHDTLRLLAYHALYAYSTSSVVVGSYYDALRPPVYHALYADSTSSVVVGSYYDALRLPAYHTIYAYSTSSVVVGSYHAALRPPDYHALYADSKSFCLGGALPRYITTAGLSRSIR